MILLLAGLVFAEEEKKQEVNKEKRLRIGGCIGTAHCAGLGIEVSNPQLTPHIGVKSSFSPNGFGSGITYSFHTDNRKYDPYISVTYGTFSSSTGTISPLGFHYGAYWRISQNLPIFLDFQVGGAYELDMESFIPSFSLSVLGGLF